jgi:hypothetical protein
MKMETEAKYICRNARDVGQRLAGLRSQFAYGSDSSEKETVWPDIAVNNLDNKGCSAAPSNAYGVSTASHGPPALHTVSFGSGLYRGEGIFVASTQRGATQKGAS